MTSKALYIEALNLSPHPEGGWYRQTFHSETKTFDEASQADRYHYTSIYFLLDNTSPSHFHQLNHDELWFFHDGSPLTIHCIAPDGRYYRVQLGSDVVNGEQFQFNVPSGTIFASEVVDPTGFGLVSCVVSPGFDFADFRMPEKAELLKQYPDLTTVIDRLAH